MSMQTRSGLNVPQGGYIKRFHDATNDVTDKDIVQQRYNELRRPSVDYNIEPDVYAVLGGFSLWIAIMSLVVIGVFILHLYFPH